MKKYAKVINEETKACEVGLGTNNKFYASIGMEEMEVEQDYSGRWYLAGYAPAKPAPTHEEARQARSQAYAKEVDPLMAEYNRKKLFELFTENEETELLEKIESAVKTIKENNPYPVEE